MKFLKIGALSVALPAFLVAIMGVAGSLIIALAMPRFWPVALLTLASTFLASYNINCAIVGKCVVWAWVLAGVMLFEITMIAVIALGSKSTFKAMYSVNKGEGSKLKQ